MTSKKLPPLSVILMIHSLLMQKTSADKTSARSVALDWGVPCGKSSLGEGLDVAVAGGNSSVIWLPFGGHEYNFMLEFLSVDLSKR
jgi:hypothetical protein